VNEVWGMDEKTHRVSPAAAVEAYGKPGMYMLRGHVMSRANISELTEFLIMAEHLERRRSIAGADADYGVFVLTPEDVDEAMN
jgi:hypothetical protein